MLRRAVRVAHAGNSHTRTVDGSTGRFITPQSRFVTVVFVLTTSHLHAS
jgi:hypothetical protein